MSQICVTHGGGGVKLYLAVFVPMYLLYSFTYICCIFFVRVRVCAIVQFCICFIKNCVDDVFCSRRPLVDLLLAHVFVFLGVFVSLIVLS